MVDISVVLRVKIIFFWAWLACLVGEGGGGAGERGCHRGSLL